MQQIPKPNFTVADVFSRIAQSTDDQGLSQRLNQSVAHAVAREQAFEGAMQQGTPHLYPPTVTCDTLSKADMLSVYSDQFAKERGLGRRFYSSILGLALHDRCPLCRVGVVGF